MKKKIKVNFEEFRKAFPQLLNDFEIEFDDEDSKHVSNVKNEYNKLMSKAFDDIAYALSKCEVTYPNGNVKSFWQVTSTSVITGGKGRNGRDHYFEGSQVAYKGSLWEDIHCRNKIDLPSRYQEGTDHDEAIQTVISKGTPSEKIKLLNIINLPGIYYTAALSGVNSIKNLVAYVSWHARQVVHIEEKNIIALAYEAQLRVLLQFQHTAIKKSVLEAAMFGCMFNNKKLVDAIKNKYSKHFDRYKKEGESRDVIFTTA